MKIPLVTVSVALLSGCSCAITSISYSPINRPPAPEIIDALARETGFRRSHDEFNRRSYRSGALGMHVTQPTGDLEFVNGHCPIPPFWIHPGRSFEKRWGKMNEMLEALKDEGSPYRMNDAGEQATVPNRSEAPNFNSTSAARGSEG